MRSIAFWAFIRAAVFVALDLGVLHDPVTWFGGWVALTLVHVTTTLDDRRKA